MQNSQKGDMVEADITNLKPQISREEFLKKVYGEECQESFDFDQNRTCYHDRDVDRVMDMKDPCDSAVVIGTPPIIQSQNINHVVNGTEYSITLKPKPIAVFLKYGGTVTVPYDGHSTNIIQKWGFERFTRSQDLFKSGIIECDKHLDVTTKDQDTLSTLSYNLGDIPVRMSLNRGTYSYYQTVIVYAFLIGGEKKESFLRDLINLGTTVEMSPNGDKNYLIATIYRDKMVVKPHSDGLRSPVSYEVLIDYLFSKGYERWNLEK